MEHATLQLTALLTFAASIALTDVVSVEANIVLSYVVCIAASLVDGVCQQVLTDVVSI